MIKFDRHLNQWFYWDFLVQYRVPDPVQPNLHFTCWTIITQATATRTGVNARLTGMQNWAKEMNRETGYNIEIKSYGTRGIFDHLKQTNPGFFRNGNCFPLNTWPFI